MGDIFLLGASEVKSHFIITIESCLAIHVGIVYKSRNKFSIPAFKKQYILKIKA